MQTKTSLWGKEVDTLSTQMDTHTKMTFISEGIVMARECYCVRNVDLEVSPAGFSGIYFLVNTVTMKNCQEDLSVYRLNETTQEKNVFQLDRLTFLRKMSKVHYHQLGDDAFLYAFVLDTFGQDLGSQSNFSKSEHPWT